MPDGIINFKEKIVLWISCDENVTIETLLEWIELFKSDRIAYYCEGNAIIHFRGCGFTTLVMKSCGKR